MRFSLLTLGLLACLSQAHAELVIYGQGNSNTTSSVTSTALPPANSSTVTNTSRYTPTNDFNRCISNLRSAAVAAGVSGAIYDRYTQNLTPDYSVIDRLNYQPEFSTEMWDYLSGLVDEERVQDGRQKIAQYRTTLQQVSQRYGVPIETVVAVWGVESNFGNISGRYPLVQALGTLSCEGRRQAYFRSEFFTTLRILQRGDLTEDQLKGSWAGAFGHTQFMPSTYDRLAVDFDGDGRRDLVSSVPDALASTANFLSKGGWQTGMPWGFEVKVPNGVSISGEGRRNKKNLSYWINQGVTRMDGSALIQGNLSSASSAGLLAPAGANGPKFLVFKNFDVIYGYNAAESYALAIALLSDRLQGKPGILAAWPTDDPGTSRAERREIQTLLLGRGHDIGEADGLIGDKSRQAIRIEQQRLGLAPTGRAGQNILRALRAERLMR